MKKVFRYFFVTLLLCLGLTATCSAGEIREEGRVLYCKGDVEFYELVSAGYASHSGMTKSRFDKVVWEESDSGSLRFNSISNFTINLEPEFEINCSSFSLDAYCCMVTFKNNVTVNGRVYCAASGGGVRHLTFAGSSNYIKEVVLGYGNVSLNADIDLYWISNHTASYSSASNSTPYSANINFHGAKSIKEYGVMMISQSQFQNYRPSSMTYSLPVNSIPGTEFKVTKYENTSGYSVVPVISITGNRSTKDPLTSIHAGNPNVIIRLSTNGESENSLSANCSITGSGKAILAPTVVYRADVTGSDLYGPVLGSYRFRIGAIDIGVLEIPAATYSTSGGSRHVKTILECPQIKAGTITSTTTLTNSSIDANGAYVNYGGHVIDCSGNIEATTINATATLIKCKDMTAKTLTFKGNWPNGAVSCNGTSYFPGLTVTNTCVVSSSNFNDCVVAVKTLNSPTLTISTIAGYEHDARAKRTITNLTCTNFTGVYCFNSSNINITGAANCTHFCGKFDDNFKATSFTCTGPITATVPKDFQFPSSMSVNTTGNCTLTFTGDSTLKGLAFEKVGNLVLKTSPVATKRVVTLYAASIGTGNIVNNVSTSSAEVVVDGGTLSWIITPILIFN